MRGGGAEPYAIPFLEGWVLDACPLGSCSLEGDGGNAADLGDQVAPGTGSIAHLLLGGHMCGHCAQGRFVCSPVLAHQGAAGPAGRDPGSQGDEEGQGLWVRPARGAELADCGLPWGWACGRGRV